MWGMDGGQQGTEHVAGAKPEKSRPLEAKRVVGIGGHSPSPWRTDHKVCNPGLPPLSPVSTLDLSWIRVEVPSEDHKNSKSQSTRKTRNSPVSAQKSF